MSKEEIDVLVEDVEYVKKSGLINILEELQRYTEQSLYVKYDDNWIANELATEALRIVKGK